MNVKESEKTGDARGRKAVSTHLAPAALGPYSQALAVDGTLYCSGQIALDPESGVLLEGGVAEQAKRVFTNLGAVLQAAGMSFADVVKVTVYMTDLTDFTTVNDVYAEFFEEPYPARATVGVASLPKGAALEVDLIAVA